MPADPAKGASGTAERPAQGLLDTNILILRHWVDPAELPGEMAISAVTLAELSAGPHLVRHDDQQAAYSEHAERAQRLDVLERGENEFDPIPFDAEAARAYGRVTAAVTAARPVTEEAGSRPDHCLDCDRGRAAVVHHEPGRFRRPGGPADGDICDASAGTRGTLTILAGRAGWARETGCGDRTGHLNETRP